MYGRLVGVLAIAVVVGACGARPLTPGPVVLSSPVPTGDVARDASIVVTSALPVEIAEAGSAKDAAALDSEEVEFPSFGSIDGGDAVVTPDAERAEIHEPPPPWSCGHPGPTMFAGPNAIAPSQGSTPAPLSPAEVGPPGPCRNGLMLSDSFTRPPAAGACAAYLRCGTLGPDGDWTVKISPDGGRLAAITAAGTLRLLATDSWVQIAQLASPVGRIDSAEFSADGVHLATLSAEAGQVALWRASDGTLEWSVFTSPPPVTDYWGSALAFSADGARLATSLGIIIDVASGGETPLVLRGSEGRYVSVVDLRFAAHDSTLFTQSLYKVGDSPVTRRIALYDLETGHETVFFDAYDYYAGGAAVSPDGTVIALANSECCSGPPVGLSLYDARTGARVGGQLDWTGRVRAFTPDGYGLIVDDTHSLQVRDLRSGMMGVSWTYPTGATFVGAGPDGTLVTTGGGETVAWSPKAGAASWVLQSDVNGITWTADGSLVVAGSIGRGGTPTEPLFRLLHNTDGIQLCAPAPLGSTAPVTAAALAADGQTLTLGRAGVVELWSGDAHRRVGILPTNAPTIRQISLSSDGSRMATRDSEAGSGGIEVRDTAQGVLLGLVNGPGNGQYDLGTFTLSGRGDLLALQDAHSLSVVDVASGAPAFAFSDPSFYYSQRPTFSPDDVFVGTTVAGYPPAIDHTVVRTWRSADGSDHGWYPRPPKDTSDNAAVSPDWSVALGVFTTGVWAWRTVDNRAIGMLDSYDNIGDLTLSGDGAVLAATYIVHADGTDWHSLQLRDVGRGTFRRAFWPSQPWLSPPPWAAPLAVLWPHGERLLTVEGPAAALWCR